MTIDISSLVAMADGEIVGKIRLQKTVYLLDQIGLNSGFAYEYFHYGPYSSDLAEKVEDDLIFSNLKATTRRRAGDGVPYVVYRTEAPADPKSLGSLSTNTIAAALREMQRRSATVLELAATIHWLSVVEGIGDWRTELFRRKGAKTSSGRDHQAFELLRALGLPPAVNSLAHG